MSIFFIVRIIFLVLYVNIFENTSNKNVIYVIIFIVPITKKICNANQNNTKMICNLIVCENKEISRKQRDKRRNELPKTQKKKYRKNAKKKNQKIMRKKELKKEKKRTTATER